MEKGLKNLSKSELIALLKESQITVEKQQASLIQKGANEFRLQSDKKRLQVEKADLKVEKTYLEAQITEYKRLLYGQSRERFIANPEQLPLPFEAPAEVKEVQQKQLTDKQDTVRKKQKKKHPGRAKLPEHLPVEEVEIYPKGDLSEMVCIGKEITEELDCVPARFFIKSP